MYAAHDPRHASALPAAGAARWLGLGLAIGLLVAACGGGTALGYASPPASLDPNSPHLAAKQVAFDTAELAVPANRAFTLVFENRENVSHNVSIYDDSTFQNRRFEGVLFNGPSTRWYAVPALAPGTYAFRCDLHPNMTGQLVAA